MDANTRLAIMIGQLVMQTAQLQADLEAAKSAAEKPKDAEK